MTFSLSLSGYVIFYPHIMQLGLAWKFTRAVFGLTLHARFPNASLPTSNILASANFTLLTENLWSWTPMTVHRAAVSWCWECNNHGHCWILWCEKREVCVCLRIYACIHVCVCVYLCMYPCVGVLIYPCVCIYACIHMCGCVCTHLSMCVCFCVNHWHKCFHSRLWWDGGSKSKTHTHTHILFLSLWTHAAIWHLSANWHCKMQHGVKVGRLVTVPSIRMVTDPQSTTSSVPWDPQHKVRLFFK